MANMDYAFEKMRTLWYQSKNDEKSTVKTCTPDMNVPKNEQTNASTESVSWNLIVSFLICLLDIIIQ
jgi:hypothetical protein